MAVLLGGTALFAFLYFIGALTSWVWIFFPVLAWVAAVTLMYIAWQILSGEWSLSRLIERKR